MGLLRVKSKEFIGHRFGRLVILSVRPDRPGTGSKTVASVRCDCGNIKDVSFSNVKKGSIKSCGCLNSEMARAHCKNLNTDHGLSRHPLYIVWKGMLGRCYNKLYFSYHNYGAIGVEVCEEWRNDFMSFFNWATNNGWAPGLQLDKDKNGTGKMYSPDNCCFLTRKENNRRKKNNIIIDRKGIKKSLPEWCDQLGLKYQTIYMRIKRGVSPEAALV